MGKVNSGISPISMMRKQSVLYRFPSIARPPPSLGLARTFLASIIRVAGETHFGLEAKTCTALVVGFFRGVSGLTQPFPPDLPMLSTLFGKKREGPHIRSTFAIPFEPRASAFLKFLPYAPPIFLVKYMVPYSLLPLKPGLVNPFRFLQKIFALPSFRDWFICRTYSLS